MQLTSDLASAQVAQWMTKKPYTCTADASLADARDMMTEYRCRRLPVVDENDELIGIVSLGDLRQAAPSSITSLSLFEVNYFWTKLQVTEAMTPEPVTVGPDDTLKLACQRMLDYKISGLPVVEGRKVVGILTETDILRFVVSLA
ncbi:MAG: CBS domain-containing protein [Caldilineaceae bacterium]|nr:CBS domain-containing protein [Caldilineaceae bacterium]